MYNIIQFELLINYNILVIFDNGEVKKFDLNPLFKYKTWMKIKDVYEQAYIEDEGMRLCWPNPSYTPDNKQCPDIDIFAEDIYEEGIDYFKVINIKKNNNNVKTQE